MDGTSVAAVLTAPGEYEVREYPIGDLVEPGEAIVKVSLCGICGTDKHTYQGYTGQYTGLSNPSETPFPIIQGHEIVGELVEGDLHVTEELGDLLQGVAEALAAHEAGLADGFTDRSRRAFMDARVQRIYAGTNEIMKVIIAKQMGL